MKKKINLFCFLTMVTMLFLSAESIITIATNMQCLIEGTQKDENKENKELLKNINILSLTPNFITSENATLLKGEKQEEIKIWPTEGYVSVKTNSTLTKVIIMTIAAITSIICTIMAIILFFRFIININKSNVFSWKNVSLLRKMGGLLIVSYIVECTYTAMSLIELNKAIDLSNYHINYLSCVNNIGLLLGIISFLIAEVFAKGLKIEEEQEFTV
ncbi:MAG: DUF2975 domain-containing protein [Bacteroidaceae bacterium]|nr:DUF2975 domain-containing protein [Bacteroidaceae bacterium]